MRDIAITLFIFGMILIILKRPWIGVMMWLWISVMSAQRFAFGFAYSFPFAASVGVATMLGMLNSKDQVKLPINATAVLLFLFPLWMSVTSLFAFEPAQAFNRWNSVMKIFIFLLVGASLINSRRHVDWMVWVIVFSVGFFGVKGGIFTILTGGANKVYGPPGDGFMSDNNAISAALVMTIPLMFYLRSIVASKLVKLALLGAAALSAMAVLGSQSRGAFLAVIAMLVFLWFKGKNKFISSIVLVLLVPVAIGFMPESWTSRMNTISTYEQDSSAMGRINAWTMAFNVANDRPLVGGGFELYSARTFAKYAPDPTDVHAAHSIYFQILGEHGYVGLALFLAIFIVGWFNASRILRMSRGKPDLLWAAHFASAIQVSLVGYAVGGMFINIGYWEIQYYEIVALMAVQGLLNPLKPKPSWQENSQLTKPVRG